MKPLVEHAGTGISDETLEWRKRVDLDSFTVDALARRTFFDKINIQG